MSTKWHQPNPQLIAGAASGIVEAAAAWSFYLRSSHLTALARRRQEMLKAEMSIILVLRFVEWYFPQCCFFHFVKQGVVFWIVQVIWICCRFCNWDWGVETIIFLLSDLPFLNMTVQWWEKCFDNSQTILKFKGSTGISVSRNLDLLHLTHSETAHGLSPKAMGFDMAVVPYFRWEQLQDDDAKRKFLWEALPAQALRINGALQVLFGFVRVKWQMQCASHFVNM